MNLGLLSHLTPVISPVCTHYHCSKCGRPFLFFLYHSLAHQSYPRPSTMPSPLIVKFVQFWNSMKLARGDLWFEELSVVFFIVQDSWKVVASQTPSIYRVTSVKLAKKVGIAEKAYPFGTTTLFGPTVLAL